MDGTIQGTGTGNNSELSAAESVVNAGTIRNYQRSIIGDDVTNTGTIVSTGNGSVYRVGGHVTNTGDGVDTGIIANIAELTVGGDVTNTGLIQSTGKGSVYHIGGNITNTGDARTTGIIVGVQDLSVDGNVTNTGLISATLLQATPQAESPYASFVVNGNFVNGVQDVDPFTKRLTQFSAQVIGLPSPDDIGDIRELYRAEKPAKQTISDLSGRTDVDYVVNYSNMSVSGKLTNHSNGFIQSTGPNSMYTYGTFDNAGVLTGVETFKINGATTPSAFQVIVDRQVGDLNGWNHMANVYDLLENTISSEIGDLVNRYGGLIEGTGKGSSLTVSGNVYNLYGSTVRNFETVRVAGSVANEGALEFLGDTFIAGDFFNNVAVLPDERNAVSGILLTNTYDGRIGKITVQGDATIKGGQLWIGGTEKLAVGKDYTFLTVADGHLTVEAPLQIRANNEYGYDTYLGNNYPIGSSNQSISAIPRLFHAEGFFTDSEYWVSLRRDFIYGQPGETRNQRSLGTYLDTIAYTLNSQSDTYTEGDLFNVLSALDNENLKGGNVPRSDYGYLNVVGNGPYTYPSTYTNADAIKAGITPEALRAVDQMAGTIYANMSMMSLQNTWLVNQRVGDMVRPQMIAGLQTVCHCVKNKHGKNTGKCECETVRVIVPRRKAHRGIDPDGSNFGVRHTRNLWGMSYGAMGIVKTDGNAPGFDYNNLGNIIGGDIHRSDNGRAGVYFAYGQTGLSENGQYQKSKTDSYKIGLYGNRNFMLGNITGTASIGMDEYSATRHLVFGSLGTLNSNFVDRTHRGRTRGIEFSSRIEQSWNHAVGLSVLQPFAAVSYTHLQIDGVQEWSTFGDRRIDGLYVTELNNQAYQLDSMRSELGARLNRCMYRIDPRLSLNARASWVHEYADSSATIHNSFTNKSYDTQTQPYGSSYNTITNKAFGNVGSYAIEGVNLGRDFLWTGFGANWNNPTKPMTFFAAYDMFANGKTMMHNGAAGMEFQW